MAVPSGRILLVALTPCAARHILWPIPASNSHVSARRLLSAIRVGHGQGGAQRRQARHFVRGGSDGRYNQDHQCQASDLRREADR